MRAAQCTSLYVNNNFKNGYYLYIMNKTCVFFLNDDACTTN